MVKVLKIILAMCLAAAVGLTAAAQPRQGVVRVKLQPEAATALKARSEGGRIETRKPGQLRTGVAPLDRSLQSIKGMSIRPVFPCSPERAAEHAKYGLDLWYEITFDTSVSPAEAQRVMKATAGVQNSTTKRTPVLFDGGSSYRAVGKEALKAQASTQMPFNDPRLSSQWHYFNDGSLPGSVAGADINLFEAWKISTGSPEVIVAIIDGGIDLKHEDLVQNLWINSAEIPNNGIDDDNNGYADDVNGWNFCTNSSDVSAHSHGTHVAGTVAAVNNNGIGVAGVAGGDGSANSGVRLMSVQVFDSRSGVGDADFAAAIIYAADNGATIAQCSWGWEDDGYYEQDILDAIRYFTNSARSSKMTGGLCIFSAGNTGSSGMFYPQCMDEVVAVGAISFDKRITKYSSYGEWVDVAAPGGLLDYSTYEGVLSTIPDNGYGYKEGTSMATPHVSGIAALILSKYGSPTLTNEALRTQLITSVNDLYSYNPGAEGILGSGYIDAKKALQWSDGTPPEAVTDLTLIPAQESIDLRWTIPHSSDNNVNNHIVYYSTEELDPENLSGASTVVIDTKFMSSGDVMAYELTGLESLTRYYVAIKAVDRWGNASALSNTMTTTTNAGPHMTLDKNAVSISASAGKTSTGTFTIGNTDEGMLKWEAYTRTNNAILTTNAMSMQPVVNRYNGHLSLQPAERIATVDAWELDRDEFPIEIIEHAGIYAYIGETDLSLPNSMAQMFTVDADTLPDGFNLTSVRVHGAYGTDPTIEVYRNNLAKSSKVLEYKPTAWAYGYSITLPEWIYFAPGEVFYIVVHFPVQDNKYPLGLGLMSEQNKSNRAYMSNDLGETWVTLEAALAGSYYEDMASKAAWCIDAISTQPDWSSVIELSPASGQVLMGESKPVDVVIDADKLINGNYDATVYFNTNESEPDDLSVKLSVKVSGHKADIVSNKVVTFGNVLVGQSKTIAVRLFNRGLGALAIYPSITSTSEHFFGPEYLAEGMPARSTSTILVTYAPKTQGSHSGEIVIRDKSGNEARIMVQGAATDPAKIAVEPESGVDAGEIAVGGDTKEVRFSIRNEGNYPLQFVMPKYSDETIDDMVSTGDHIHRFGYTWLSNLNGGSDFAYSAVGTLNDAVDVTDQFNNYTYFTSPIELGFDFPFYGKNYDKVHIFSFGAITFNTYEEGLSINNIIDDSRDEIIGMGIISAFGATELGRGPKTKIEYGHRDGNFVVNFENVLASAGSNAYTPISFHIVLSPSGDIEVHYDNYNRYSLFGSGTTLYCGINDPDIVDPLTVTSAHQTHGGYTSGTATESETRYQKFTTGSAVKFMAPKPDMIKNIAPVTGLLAPGQSKEVTVEVGATDAMYAGPTFNNVVINTNDPANSTKLVRIDAFVTGDLKPELSVAESLDFGRVFMTSQQTRQLSVKNTGKNTMNITGAEITSGNSRFTVDIQLPVAVEPGQSKDVPVSLVTTSMGAAMGELTVTTDAGTATVALSAEIGGTPRMRLGYTSLEETLDYGNEIAKPLSITNQGNEEMVYYVEAGQHISYQPVYDDNSEVNYSYVASVDMASAKSDWVDIETNGLGTQHDLGYYLSHDFIAVDLPFEFTFYGKKYTRMYVYNAGFISFTERNDDVIWPDPPAYFPSGSVYTNVIAPYWGQHSMDQTRTAGTYHYVTDDRAVVSFMEYGNTLNLGVCFQVILRNDGSFTFNYKGQGEYAVIFNIFGVAGISNEDGSKGISLPARMVEFGNSVHFNPIVENTLQPGRTHRADITLKADALAGTYSSSIVINTNVPGSERVQVPVRLNINGRAIVSVPETTEMEQVTKYQPTPQEGTDQLIQMGAAYYAPITVRNNGTAAFTIRSISSRASEGLSLYYLDSEDGWLPYDDEELTVGTAPVVFAYPVILGSDIWQTMGDYTAVTDFDILCDGDTESQTYTNTLTYHVTDIPVITFDRPAITVYAPNDSYTTDETVTVGNDGRYTLYWSVELDPTGNGAADAVDAGNGGIMPMAVGGENVADLSSTVSLAQGGAVQPTAQPFETGPSSSDFDVPVTGGYDDYLYWPIAPNGGGYMIGSGTTTEDFYTSTLFKGPEGGFNISAIYTMIVLTPGNASSDLSVQIINGNDASDQSEVLGYGSFHLDGSYNDMRYYPVIINLKRPVYISEGQEFLVVVKYGSGFESPVIMVQKKEAVVTGRYACYSAAYGDDWIDIGESFRDSYGSMGWVTTCLQRTPGEFWVKMLTEETSGSIEPGETAQVSVRLNAATAPKDLDNKAMLVFRSNDIAQPVVNYPIYLDRNAAPMIFATSAALVVDEGSKVNTDVKIIDPDGDNVIINLDDNGALTAIEKITSIDGSDFSYSLTPDRRSALVNGAGAGVIVTLAIEPDYGDEGDYTVYVVASDIQGHEEEVAIRYSVLHVNRAPEAAPTETIEIGKDKASDPIDMTSFFTDPDGDELTFEYNLTPASMADVYQSGNSLILVGRRFGSATLHVTATDPSGASAKADINVSVTDLSGVENVAVATDIAIWPNPVVETLYVVTDFSDPQVTYNVHNMTGAVVISETAATIAGQPNAIAIGHLPAGIYILRLTTSGGATTTREVIKK